MSPLVLSWESWMDLMKGYWVPLSPACISSSTFEFLGVRSMGILFPWEAQDEQSSFFPSLFILLYHPSECLDLLINDPAVTPSWLLFAFFFFFLGVYLVLTFQNLLNGPILLSLFWLLALLIKMGGLQAMINMQVNTLKNSLDYPSIFLDFFSSHSLGQGLVSHSNGYSISTENRKCYETKIMRLLSRLYGDMFSGWPVNTISLSSLFSLLSLNNWGWLPWSTQWQWLPSP